MIEPPKVISLSYCQKEWDVVFEDIWNTESFIFLKPWQPYVFEPCRYWFISIRSPQHNHLPARKYVSQKIVDRLLIHGWPCYSKSYDGDYAVVLLHPEYYEHRLWFKIKTYFKERWNWGYK